MAAFLTTAAIARSTPCWMSDVVAVLCQASTLSFCKITLRMCQQATGASGNRFSDLSVLVPPTSIPITHEASLEGISVYSAHRLGDQSV